MICRYIVQCPGCNAKILLRISVGIDLEQPFYYVCGRCNAATRGKLLIWYEPRPGGKLELEAGKVLKENENPNQVITLHPDLPSKAEARDMREPGGSPFLMHFNILGNRFYEFEMRLRIFREVADRDWVNVRRWIGYYLDENWEQFDQERMRLLGKSREQLLQEWQRHDVIHRALDIMFMPLCLKPYYPIMKEEWCEVFSLAAKKPAKLKAFVRESVESGEIRNRQRDIFHCLELFIENRSGILPGLAADMYPAGQRAALRELRLFREEFPQLRDLYIATFEICHHALKFVMGIINIVNRGSPDDFGPKGPRGLGAFEKLANSQKAALLTSLPEWKKRWGDLLNRRIRNVIGHHSVRHDLPSGLLVLRDGSQITYLEFVVMTLRLVQPILLTANILKTFYVAFTLDK